MLSRAIGKVVFIFFLIAAVTPLASASPINLLTFDESRVGVQTNDNGSINFNFATSGAFSTLRNDLLDSANFGSGGVVSRPVNFMSSVGSLTAGALAGADVFVLPYSVSLTSEEMTALGDFMQNGGGVLFMSNWAAEGFAEDVLGATPGPGASEKAWVTDPGSPVVSGPFGVVSAPIEDPFYLMWNLSFSDVGPYGHEVLQSDLGVFGASFEYGQGRAVFFTDEELFMDQPGVDGIAAPNLSERSEKMFLNSFAYVIPDRNAVIPEPSTMALMAMGLAWGFLKRRKS